MRNAGWLGVTGGPGERATVSRARKEEGRAERGKPRRLGPSWAGAAGKRRKVSGPGCWAAGKKKKKKAGLGRCGNKEVRAGLFSGLGWIAKGFGFPFSILFPNSNQTNTIRIQIQI